MKPQSPIPSEDEFRLVVASNRWAVHAFFSSLRERGLTSLVIDALPNAAKELDAYDDVLVNATAVAVDIAVQPAGGTELCRALHARQPTLPIIALLCCPQGVNPWHLQEVLGVGASVLDLQATPEEAVRALESIARGASVLHLHLRRGHRSLLRDVLSGRETTTATRVRLLELVSLGLPDHEIGRRLYLSPHTVKHHIEGLRDEVGVRNRTELAAWAGRHGFYEPESDRGAVPVRVQVARPPSR